jgi:signal transduction histidine kinase
MPNTFKKARDPRQRMLFERTIELDKTKMELAKQSKLMASRDQEIRELSGQLLRAQDEERKRIARNLHDSLGQGLALLCFDLSRLAQSVRQYDLCLADEISARVIDVRTLGEEVRTISYLLHPPLLQDLGLIAALRWYVAGFQKRSNVTVDLRMPHRMSRLAPDLETTIFRVVQECLTNIYRHAESRTASVKLARQASKLCLSIRDYGKGIPHLKLREIASQGSEGVGLRGIQERIKIYAGNMEVSSANPGTLIQLVIPTL